MQMVTSLRDGKWFELSLPDADTIVMDGADARWGAFTSFGTPAFWKATLWLDNQATYRAGALAEDLRNEVALCMLAGFGMPSELGLAAYERLRERGLIDQPDQYRIEQALREPLNILGSWRRYRFPKQKSRFLACALGAVVSEWEHLDPLSLRNILMTLPGIGPKTASWIVRNRTGCDDVAIFDVHVVRICVHMRLFERFAQSRYLELERQFVRFSRVMEVKASALDNAIWQQARLMPRDLIDA